MSDQPEPTASPGSVTRMGSGDEIWHRPLRQIFAGALSGDTAQTTGMRRLEAISGKTVGADKLWMGETHVSPDTSSGDHHHGEAETGGYVLSGRARIYFGEKFEDYVDMEEGDWVFVPPFMPHIECNLDRNRSLTWMTTRTPENIVVNLDDVPDEDLRDWLTR